MRCLCRLLSLERFRHHLVLVLLVFDLVELASVLVVLLVCNSVVLSVVLLVVSLASVFLESFVLRLVSTLFCPFYCMVRMRS